MTIYSKSPCKACVELKLWLKIKGITNYKEVSLDDNIEMLREKGFWGAPVVEINGQFINGAIISNVADALRQEIAIA